VESPLPVVDTRVDGRDGVADEEAAALAELESAGRVPSAEKRIADATTMKISPATATVRAPKTPAFAFRATPPKHSFG